jgi:hypothetical protein
MVMVVILQEALDLVNWKMRELRKKKRKRKRKPRDVNRGRKGEVV